MVLRTTTGPSLRTIQYYMVQQAAQASRVYVKDSFAAGRQEKKMKQNKDMELRTE
jgi:hypothetical protein